jgi:hypothetical protein
MNETSEILPGWKLEITEQPNNTFLFTATGEDGYKAEITDSNWDVGYQKCLLRSFEIQQKIGRDRNKFFYDIFIQLIGPKAIKESNYHENAMGSWEITGYNSRLMLDGKDMVMWTAIREKKLFREKWIGLNHYSHLENLSYSDLKNIATEVK